MHGRLDAQLRRAVALHNQRLPEQAALLYVEILRAQPYHPDALHLLGVAETQLGRPRSGLEWIAKSLAINPNQPAAIANQGNAHLSLDEPADALACYEAALASWPDYAPALYGRGNALAVLGQLAAALECFERATELNPKFVEALIARAGVLCKLDRPQEALASCDRAITASPAVAQAHIGRAAALRALKVYGAALKSADRAVELAPTLADAFLERGHALAEFNQTDAAIADYERAMRLKPTLASAWSSHGLALSLQGRFRESLASLRRALELDPRLPYVPGASLHAKLQLCDWSGYTEAVPTIDTAVELDEPVDFPFSFLAVSDSPRLQLKCARRFADLHRLEAAVLRPAEGSTTSISTMKHRDDPVIRVAYISADFLEHPTSYLMAGLFEKHDRQCFEITGISLRDDDFSPTARRVKAAFDRIVSAEWLSDAALADRIRDLKVDVAVDLMGYTGAHRAGLWAHRPAPVQVSYLGFPATTGSRNVDYVIADDFLIPEAERDAYSESIAYLPECFQANDDQRPTSGETPTRAQMNLPSTGLVLCSFHSSYKLNPPLFDRWSRILSGIPGSVLWLLGGNPALEDNLTREAVARGIAPERLVFAQPLPYPNHLARLALADLCLDTLPFNGGATTSDALWAGVPVVSCAGRSFASRMSGSLLHAIGIPELATRSLDEYERLALALGRAPQSLARLRAKLAENRRSAPLFNTDRFRQHLEAAYTVMVQRQRSGLAPATFRVPLTAC